MSKSMQTMPSIDQGDHPAGRIINGYKIIAKESITTIKSLIDSLNDNDLQALSNIANAMEIAASNIQRYIKTIDAAKHVPA